MSKKRIFPHGKQIVSILQRRRELIRQRTNQEGADPGVVDVTALGQEPRQVCGYVEAKRNGATLELLLYGVIGEDFWGDGVSALDVATILAEHTDAEKIEARMNSPGGDVFDGIAIYNALASHGAEVETICDGLAASAASVIFEAGDKRTMREASRLMIHRAWTWAVGNAEELRAIAEILDGIDEETVQLFDRRTGDDGATADELRELLAGEGAADGSWFTADQAIQKGLADAQETDDDDSDSAEPAQAAARNRKTIDYSQLGGLRVAALYADFPTKPQGETTVREDTANTAGDAGDVTEPAAATFAQLDELSGGDAEFIVAQQKADATIEQATQALVVRLRERAEQAEEGRTTAEKERDDLKQAGDALNAENSEVSGQADAGEGSGKGGGKTFRDLIRMPK